MCAFKNDTLLNDANYNVVTIVMKNESVGVDDGFQWISDTHDDVVENFLSVREDVLSKRGFPSFGEDVDSQIAAYIDGLGIFRL